MNRQPNTCHVLLLMEAENLTALSEDLRKMFPTAIEETEEETVRHRNWFHAELGAFSSAQHPVRHSIAFRLEAEPATQPDHPAAVLVSVMAFIEKWRGIATIGCASIDTQCVAYAVAGAFCTDSAQAIIGSWGHNRRNYLRVMAHFFYADNPSALIEELSTGEAMGPPSYRHRCQWSAADSPLRLEFLTEDPSRGRWGLSFSSKSQTQTLLVEDGFLPPVGVSVMTRVSWLNALIILLRAQDLNIFARLDVDGQLMISGYLLRAVGIIDETLKPLGQLTKEESLEFDVGDPPREDTAMISVMKLYCDFLNDAEMHAGFTDIQLSRIRDHLDGALNWLIEAGHIDLRFAAPTSKLVH